ncbi:MAG TPA: glycoside hydrolase family 6 protein [Nocardioides sp.]|uniref:glycoside hydrolase family 6 protein n=1 Tax=Nocardioides sp. TaxID=35761 RepID=UPI002F42ECEB
MKRPSRRTVASLLALAGLGLVTGVPGAGDAAAAASRSSSSALTVPMPPAPTANPGNPLAGRAWGVFRGPADPAWQPYVNASGTRKQKLATIALAPKAKFFGAWIPDSEIAEKVRQYVANATGGDPDVLVQLTLFRMVPWESEACQRLPTKAERRSYRRYVDIVAQTLGDTHAAVILQPDGPFLRCVPRGSSVPAGLLSYAARTLSAQPNVSVYVEMGSADWFRDRPADAVRMLRAADVQYARGFALDTSHFDSVGRQIDFGASIVSALAQDGIPHRHFVIDTSDNGHAFTGAWYHQHHPSKPLGYAEPCASADQTHCVALGIPPTTDVGAPEWGLSDRRTAAAEKLVDGYLWVSRPWLAHQSGAFSLDRALAEIRYSPYR